MADKEIPDLTSGGAAAAGDVVHAFRTPNSRKVTLGGAAGLSVGTGAGTVAAGNDSRLADASTSAKGIVELATAAEFRAGTDTGRPPVVSEVWSAAGFVTITDGATLTFDMSLWL